jgi:general secretion pathway protein A
MYEDFYRLEKPPFRLTPDPEFLYLSPSHREALASIVYGVEERKGFVLVLGEVGLGKTTIVRSYLNALDTKRVTVAYIFNANVSFKALLDTIYQDLGIPDEPEDIHGMVNRLHEVVIQEYRRRRNVVLIIDEAQNMPVETLESLRVLSNLETSTDKLIQIVLIGQPEFAAKLDLHELRQLKQRIPVRCAISPFTDAESRAYIEHRLSKAGASTSSVFTPLALRRIVKAARGIPRMLNILCDNALITGLGYQRKPVTAGMVGEVIADLRGRAGFSRQRWLWTALVAVIVIVPFVSVVPGMKVWLSGGHLGTSSPPPSSPSASHRPARVTVSLRPPDENSARNEASQPALDAPPQKADEPLAAGALPRERPWVATRVVKEGDSLSELALAVYGFSSEQVLQRIVDRSPRITHVDSIQVGTTIRFPDVADLRARRPRTMSRDQ